MAYQTRGRDPLLDSTMQAALEKRSRELFGIGLIVAGVMAVLMIATYSPDDPNWLLASDAPVENWLGRFGASIAHPLFTIIGHGAWVIPAVLIAWGARLAGHWGEDRLVSRLVFAPIAVALTAIYCATLATGPGWEHSFGKGGLFADTVLSILLTVLPVSAGFGVKLLSFVLAIVMVWAVAFVMGFTTREIRIGLRWVLWGLVMAYDLGLRLAGRTAAASVGVAQGARHRMADLQAARRERAAERAEAMQHEIQPEPALTAPRRADPELRQRVAAVVRANPAMPGAARPPEVQAAQAEVAPLRMPPIVAERAPLAAPPRPRGEDAAPAPRAGLLSRVPGLLRRSEPAAALTPELVETEVTTRDVAAPDEDRIRSRISDAIRARSRLADPEPRQEPPVVRPKGPRPLILDTTPRATGPALPPEPPLTGAARSLPPAPPVWQEPPRAAPEPELPDWEDTIGDEVIEDEEDEVWSAPVAARPVVPVAEPRRPAVLHAAKKPTPSARARAEAQPKLPLEERFADYEYPPLGLLTDPAEIKRHHLSDDALSENARMLENVLDDYGVKGEITSVRPGPVVTMYELEPAPGLKASRVIGLADDIARSMSALSARVSTVPGRSVIGIELPNANREKVVLREILSHRDFGDSQMKLPLALGKDIGGEPVVANLAKMPHLLIAGTTGSGKSVAINTMILSLLYKLTPDECRLIMIDPKMLELSVYDGIPHLLSPVVTDPKKAVVALKWVVGEMEERYRKMSKMGVRNIDGYNGRVADALGRGEMFSRTVQTGFDEETGDPIFETEEFAPEKMPYIVVIVDEMADLMMVAGKEIEACIQRLAQMARASGIHLIMATQRPSVDVITGTIKANFPTRISFQVTSKIDSRTILGEQGAEQLLGMGDMLYMAGGGRITRIHGPFCSDEEVEEIVTFLKGYGPPEYVSGVVEGPDEDRESDIDAVLGLSGSGGNETDDALYDMAVQIVARDRKCSTSYIQRKLAIGYNKAARLVEQMEEQGVVTPANHVGKREILVPEVH